MGQVWFRALDLHICPISPMMAPHIYIYIYGKEGKKGGKKGCRQRWRGTENRNLPVAPMRPEDSKPSRQEFATRRR